MERRLVSILAVDAASYSRLVEMTKTQHSLSSANTAS